MGFAGARARMNHAIFARLGEAATWTGVSLPVQVIPREEDGEIRFDRRARLDRTHFLRVRKAEVAAPVTGDEAVIAALGVTYRVIAEPQLARHQVWVCEVEHVA